MSTPNIIAPPRWSISYPITGEWEHYEIGTTETVLVQIPINFRDYPQSTSKLTVNVSGWYNVIGGQGIFRLRLGGTPRADRAPRGDIIAELKLPPPIEVSPLPAFTENFEIAQTTTLLQVTMCNSNANGQTNLLASYLTVNGF